MDAYHRREALLNWLRSRGTATAAEAADKFGVSTRTVLRDVAALRDRGEPIESDAGRGGGLRVDLLRSLPPVRVRLEDVVGLFMWTHLVRLSASAPMSAAVEPAVEKMMGVLPPHRAGEIRRALRRVVVGRATGGPPGQPGSIETLVALERALNARRGVLFTLADGEVLFEVQGLLLEGHVWSIIGVDRADGAMRRLRIDRVTHAVLVDEVRVQHVPIEGAARRATDLPAGVVAEGIRAPA